MTRTARAPFLDLVRKRVVFYDGAMGASIQTYGLDAAGYGGIEGCNENLVFHNPGLIEEIHASFFDTGVDVIETDTFGGSRLKLDEYGLGERTYEQNRAAAALARGVADHYTTASRPPLRRRLDRFDRAVAGVGRSDARQCPLRRSGRAVSRSGLRVG